MDERRYKMKKKLAFVDLTNFKDWPMGGMLQYELSILPYLCDHYDIDIWGVSVDGIKPQPILIKGKKYPVHVWTDVKTHKKLIPNFWRGLFLKKYVKKFKKYDGIYAHTATCLMPFFKLQAHGTKIFYHQHGLIYLRDPIFKTKIQIPFMKRAQIKSNVTFIVSGPKLVKEYGKTLKKHGKFISIDSPVNRFNKTVSSKLNNKFIYTGRITDFKGVSFLVDVFNAYLKEDPTAELTVVGDGDALPEVKKKIYKYGLKDKIHLMGKMSHDEVIDELLKNTIFVTASEGEGVSVSVAEANVLGLPTVCLNVNGLNEQIVDGKNGIKAKNKTIEAMCTSMVNASKNWNKLHESTLEFSKKYDSKRIANKIINNIDRELD